jgi:cytochrome bd-type quinol oxidase subunit 2
MMLTSAVMAVSIAIVARKKHPDLQAWAWALSLQVVGYAFLVMPAAFPETMPEDLSVVLGNSALCAA